MSRRGGGRRQDTRPEPQQPSPSVYRGGRGDARGGRGDTRGGRGDTRGGRGDARGGRGDTRGGRGGSYRGGGGGGGGGPAFTPPISDPTSLSSSAAPTGVAATAPSSSAGYTRGGRGGSYRGRGGGGPAFTPSISDPTSLSSSAAPTGVAAAAPSSSAGSISFGSHVASSSTEIVTKGVEKLQLGAPPSSSKAVVVAQRPGYGTLGQKCVVKANHFLVRASVNEIFHYDV